MWKPIIGYEGIYEVSDNGEIRTCKGKTTQTERHGTRHWKQRVLKQKTDKGNYKRITLWKDGKPKDFLVHRLVALAFCEKPDGCEIINHIDCNPSNNHITNLEWCDYKHNLAHAYENGLNNSPKRVRLTSWSGETHEFISYSEASRFLGHSNGFISSLLAKGRSHVEGYTITPF